MGDFKLQGVTPAAGKIKLGSSNVSKIYSGSTQVWVNGYVFADRAELKTAVDLWTGTAAQRASALNTYGEINSWDTGNVTTMHELFKDKTTFNDDISNWNVSNVAGGASTTRGMFYMFGGASSFNQNIGSWNVSSVTNMRSMFFDATAFNNNGSSSIGNWNVSSVTFFNFMFYQTNFNQDISAWCVENIPSAPAAFSTGAPLTAANTPNWGVTCP